jgi:nucleoside-diphosphate-sugar epimerase
LGSGCKFFSVSMHLFITGIGGFIGKQTAKRALERGWKVSGIDANPDSAQMVQEEFGIDVAVGDISQQVDCNLALQQADVVLNTAAIVQEDGDWVRFRAVNVQGALNVARAAKRAGVKQYIQLSSVMVYGFNYVSHVTEEGLVSGDNNPYCQTKIESEIALKRMQADDFAITIIRPGDVYGPGSVPWVIRPLEMMRQWQFMHIDDGRGCFNFVYIDNLVDAIFLATNSKAYGQTYNVTDGAVTNKEFFNALAEMAGVKWIPSVPSFLVKPMASILSKLMKGVGRKFQVNEQAIRYMLRPHPYSNEKIKRELGYQPKIDLQAGLRLTEEWLKTDRSDLMS